MDVLYYGYVMEQASLTHSKKTRIEKTTTFEELQPIFRQHFPEIEVEQFACNHLLTKAKQMCAARSKNEDIRACFERENTRYPRWIEQIDMTKQSLYRRLIYRAMYEADPVRIKCIMKLREIFY